MNLNELIDEHQTNDPDETAAAVFDAVACPAKWRELFYKVVRDECRRQARNLVRHIEATGGHRRDDTHTGSAAGGSRTAFLATKFYNGEKYVTWGEATTVDHEGRIASLSRLAGGINTTIGRHRDAIERIVARGVTCLDELDDDNEVAA